ncbi:uncharacterized protein MKK02DRAFT_42509 [Dioszegia hungarica]|uniref:Uncharacterized protein n=1 Tax=Dioszegia hungarica TaxID=4972 RepID=A0AA38HD13_9TREE|nr:uncharacterized protein MKK02DRAFT_42509 [Dioszegia hungarica]KAI9638121.1 hypothetical protein MKK02DRAFT_42509 [Dioszegia hungarica]
MRSTIALALFSAAAVFAAPVAKRADGGNAYTGLGGQAIGGSSTEMSQGDGPFGQGNGLADNAKVINAFSGNAGDGGKAKSGDALGGKGAISYSWIDGNWVASGKGGDAYTGLGGVANGGNKGEYHYDKRCFNGQCGSYGYGHNAEGLTKNLKLGQIATGNAGDGGDASSGSAVGGDVAGVRYTADSPRYTGEGIRYY